MTHLAWLRTITEIVTFYTSRHLFDRTKVKKNNNNEKNNHELSIKKKNHFLKNPIRLNNSESLLYNAMLKKTTSSNAKAQMTNSPF